MASGPWALRQKTNQHSKIVRSDHTVNQGPLWLHKHKGCLQLWTYHLREGFGKTLQSQLAAEVLFSRVTLPLGHLNFTTVVQTSKVVFSIIISARSCSYIIFLPVKVFWFNWIDFRSVLRLLWTLLTTFYNSHLFLLTNCFFLQGWFSGIFW